VELEQKSATHQVSQEEEWLEDMYLGQMKKENHRIQQLLFTSMAFPSAHTWTPRLKSRWLSKRTMGSFKQAFPGNALATLVKERVGCYACLEH